TVDLDEDKPSTLDLLDRMGFKCVVDRQLLHAHAEERFEVFERKLEEGELIAFEILGASKAKPGRGRAPERVENADPQVGIAIGLRPVAAAGMQVVPLIGSRREIGKYRSVSTCEHVI